MRMRYLKVGDNVSYGETHELKKRGYGVERVTANGELWRITSPPSYSGTTLLSPADCAYVKALTVANILAPSGPEQRALDDLLNDVQDRLEVDENTMQRLNDEAPRRESFEP